MPLTEAQKFLRYRAKHPEKFTAEYRRKRRRKSDEKYRTTDGYKNAIRKYKGSEKSVDRDLRCKYGISLEDKKKMLLKQKGLCGICHKPLPKVFGQCFVEHDHVTRKVRSLVHRKCNIVLGFIENNPELTLQCEGYLLKHHEKTHRHTPKTRKHTPQHE